MQVRGILSATAAIMALCATGVRADIFISGLINGGSWSEDEVVTMTGDTSVTGLLTVAPGVRLQAAPGTRLTIEGDGQFEVNGTAAKPVILTSGASSPACGDWKGLLFQSGTQGHLHHAIIQFSDIGIEAGGTASPEITDCIIEDLCGAPGADGSTPGGMGQFGGFAAGIALRDTAAPAISRTIIRRLRGGRGGDGQPAVSGSKGGNGGMGGDAYGIQAYEFGDLESLLAMNGVEISDLKGGDGGNGAAGTGGGGGGNGGKGGFAAGIYLSGRTPVQIRNVVIHDVARGGSGTPGAAEPPGNPGLPAFVDSCVGIEAFDGNVTIDHATIHGIGNPQGGETSAISYGEFSFPGMSVEITNSTFSEGRGSNNQATRDLFPGAAASITYCNTFNFPPDPAMTGAAGMISVDPLFVNAPDGDFHLTGSSPLIGAATPTDTLDDYEGQQRDAAPDIGADEYVNAYDGRAVGDFTGDFCTDLSDFLFMLDNWQLVVNGVQVGLNDFLALLDNWRQGPSCI